MNRKDTATVCAILKAAFPVWNTSPETIEMYHAMLQDIPAEIAMRAVQDWVLTSEKFPTIAGIRRKCAEVAGVLAPSATEAWAEVSDIAERYGYQSYDNNPRPKWSHELIRKTVKAITWWELTSGSNPSAVRAQFIKMYNDYASEQDNRVITSTQFEVGGGMVALPYSTVVQSEVQSLTA